MGRLPVTDCGWRASGTQIVLVQGDDLALLLLLYHTICHGLLMVRLCLSLQLPLRLLLFLASIPSIARLAPLAPPAAGCRFRPYCVWSPPGWSLQQT